MILCLLQISLDDFQYTFSDVFLLFLQIKHLSNLMQSLGSMEIIAPLCIIIVVKIMNTKFFDNPFYCIIYLQTLLLCEKWHLLFWQKYNFDAPFLKLFLHPVAHLKFWMAWLIFVAAFFTFTGYSSGIM